MSIRLPVALVAIMFVCAAHAQTPQKPVRLVVPFAAGSATDTVARLLAQGLGERLKGSFLVENRAGANGAIAAEHVARSAPDGHTFFMATVSTHSQVPWMMKKPPYDPVRDFTPVAGVGGFSFLIVVHPSVPARTMRDFVAFAKARPGQLTYGAPGGTAQICAETVGRRTGLNLAPVAYKSSPQALVELMGGQIAMICSDFATAISHVRSGRVRALAITTGQRSGELPDLPTLNESLGDFVEMRSWIGVLGPAGTPREVVDTLGREVLAVTSQPEFRAKLAPLGFERLPLTAPQLASFIQTELAKWGELIRQAGIEPQ